MQHVTTAPESVRQNIAAAFFLIATAVSGQTAQQRHFEVASIKAGGDLFSIRPERTGGRIRWTTQLCYLIAYAYQLDSSRVSGAKCGLTYALEATFDPSATDEQIRLMAQALLLDRFRMRSHRVTTEANGYALTIGKGSLKVKKVEAGDKPPPMPEGDKDASPALRAETYIAATVPQAGVIAITGRRVSISQLAETLQRSTSIPVWD